MEHSRLAALAARFGAFALAGALAGASPSARSQSCAAAGSPGAMFGGGVAAAVLGAYPGPTWAALAPAMSSDPALRALLEAPASCAPSEPASREPAVPSVAAGNPVDLVTGAKYERAVDVRLAVGSPGTADPLDFVFARHYSSATPEASVLGPGWRHSFETRLMVEPSRGRLQPFVLQADGRRVRFTARRPVARGAIRRRAARHDDGVLDERPGAADGTWTWRWPNGRQLVFDAGGRLARIVTADRESIALNYGEDGRLRTVVDDRGHRVDLRYYSDAPAAAGGRTPPPRRDGAFPGRLAALALPTGSEVSYRYDREGRLESVRALDGARVGYRYEDPRGASRLTGVTRPGRGRSEYRYDEQGRVAYSRAAGADESDALRFAYEAAGGRSEGGSTRIAWGPGGTEHAEYRWRIAADGVAMLETSDGDQCRACPPVGRRYGWSPAADLASIEYAGTRLDLVRDVRGRLREARLRRGAGSPDEFLAEVRWSDDPVLDLATLVRRPSVVAGRWHDLSVRYEHDGRVRSLVETGYAPSGLGGGAGRAAAPVRVSRSVRVDRAAREPGAARAWLASAVARSAGMEAVAAMARDAGALVVRHDPRAGRLTVTTPAGRRVRYAFDDFDREVFERSPDWGTVRRRHDAAGRIVEETLDGAGRARQRYDSRGRLVEHVVRDPTGHEFATRYRYAGGMLAGVDHPEQRERFEYDPDGRIAVRTVAIRRREGPPLVVRFDYRYDASTGRLVERRLSGGATLRYRRGARGRLTTVSRAVAPGGEEIPVAAIERSSAGVERIRYGNGVEGRIVRDPLGRGASLRYAAAADFDRALPVLEHSLRFDGRANPVLWSRQGRAWRLSYDRAGHLVEAALRTGAARGAVSRYAYDRDGTRVLAQEAAGTAGDGVARGAVVVAGSHRVAAERRASGDARALAYDAAGRLVADGPRRYRWSPSGQLLEALESGRVLARYRYDHRGERIAKEAAGAATYFVYEDRRLVAEFGADGRLEREYVWLGNFPVAQVERDATGRERVAFLHPNHLGAPEAATDEAASVVWRAEYAPFGRAQVRASALRVALRLPGQYEDAETGLHYNDHRYYDPLRGRYLSPDPLGLRGGLDPYAYAGGNPARNVDPTGLLLFAFDGTGNSDPPQKLDDWSNVYKLASAYADGRVWYMSGVGTDDAASGIRGGLADALLASSARSRVDRMLAELDRTAADASNRGRPLQVDVIGFSRGAAIARDFANRVADLERNGHFGALGSCVRLRFLGLWDTVAQFGLDGIANLAWRLAVPAEVAYAAQAVALNEHRALFPAESIAGSPAGGTRVERGFVGAHADVGGSYAEGDLSDVALVWMREQAVAAGVPMYALTSEFQRVTEPWLHDSSAGGLGDREFRYRNSLGIVVANPFQRVARVDGLQWSGTGAFIAPLPAPLDDAYGKPTLAGRVDMDSYGAWLAANYSIAVAGP